MSTRELNAAGYSLETIAAEYETDAALAEAGPDASTLYFRAALRAERAETEADIETFYAREGSTP